MLGCEFQPIGTCTAHNGSPSLGDSVAIHLRNSNDLARRMKGDSKGRGFILGSSDPGGGVKLQLEMRIAAFAGAGFENRPRYRRSAAPADIGVVRLQRPVHSSPMPLRLQ